MFGTGDKTRVVFGGAQPLGSRLHSPEAVRAWFGRLRQLLPDPRFCCRASG